MLVAAPATMVTEAGLRVPVALTAAAWADTVAWDAAAEDRKMEATGQDEAGRLWDVLTMATRALRVVGSRYVTFDVLRVPAHGRGIRPRLTRLHLVVGPGDDGEQVLTILRPGED